MDANDNTYLFDGISVIRYNGTEYAYTVSAEGVASFYTGAYNVTCTLNGDGTMTANFQDDYGEENFNQTATFVEKDAFAGTWTLNDDSDNYCQFILEFDGYGTITVTSLRYPGNSYYNGTGTYAISGNVATFNVIDYDWTCTLNEDGTLDVWNIDEYQEGGNVSGTFTNMDAEEEPAGDAFQGTWVDGNNNTYVFDGQSSVSYNGDTYSYTINDSGAAVFYNGTYTITCTLNEDGSMNANFQDDYGEEHFNQTATKQ